MKQQTFRKHIFLCFSVFVFFLTLIKLHVIACTDNTTTKTNVFRDFDGYQFNNFA